jgi:hypothetical protein
MRETAATKSTTYKYPKRDTANAPGHMRQGPTPSSMSNGGTHALTSRTVIVKGMPGRCVRYFTGRTHYCAQYVGGESTHDPYNVLHITSMKKITFSCHCRVLHLGIEPRHLGVRTAQWTTPAVQLPLALCI